MLFWGYLSSSVIVLVFQLHVSFSLNKIVNYLFFQIHVSFSLNGTPHVVNDKKATLVSDILEFILNSIGATLTEMKDVELR